MDDNRPETFTGGLDTRAWYNKRYALKQQAKDRSIRNNNG